MAEKQEMTSLDIRFLVKELRKSLTGGIIRKIYQYGKAGSRQFLFEVFVPQKGAEWLYVDSNKIFITKRKKASPQEPPTFCMFLRKHLMGARIKSVRQHEFDRIVEVITDNNVLILELFSTGNVILCDSLYNIIMPLEFQKWKGREVKPKVEYKYPPKLTNPFEVDFDSFRRGMARSDKKLAGFLATAMGLGPEYAKEACARAGVNPEKQCSGVLLEEASRIHKAIALFDSEKLNPCVYSSFVSPFPLKILNHEKPRFFQTLSEALDEFFSEQQIEIAKEEAAKRVSEEKGKIERVVEQQREAREKWIRIINESTEKGNMIYNHYPLVQAAIEGISRAKASGMEWNEIKKAVTSEQSPEAESIKEIREGDGIVVLELGGKDVEIEFNKSVEENAARYYEDAKWAKKKMEGLGEAAEGFREKLEKVEREKERILGEDFKNLVFPKEKADKDMHTALDELVHPPAPAGEQKAQKKRWYERFRWFFSSDGFLVVGGRNAEQNETLLKKHTEPNDIVFHADIQGAAFVVVKTQGLDVPESTKREAAEFAAACSKAWSRGLGTIDIFSVTRDKVSKTPPSGQYLPKGSFMIHGEREWYRNLELKLSIGIKLNRDEGIAKVVSGPVMAVRKNSDYFVTLKPGLKKSLELARLIKNKILVKARPEDRYLIEKLPLEEIQVAVPAGMADIVEHAGEAV